MREKTATQQPTIGKSALEGLRILDLADESAVYATRILADLGAEVIRIEPPQGDAMHEVGPLDPATGRSLFYAFMNINKSAVSLDLETASGLREFTDLVASAHVVVETFGKDRLSELGIESGSMRRRNPGLVWTSVTPFGAEGPRARWRADDIISQAMGGLMRLSGTPDREPLRLFGNQSCYIAGLHAASATLIAVLHAEATGSGQDIDVSIQECIAHTLENAIQFYDAQKTVREREGASPEAGVGLFRCRDGLVYLYASAWMIRASWHGLVAWMNEQDVEGASRYSEERWLDMAFRKTGQAREELRASIEQLAAKLTKKEFYEESQRRGILAAPLNTVPDLLQNPQLSYYDWFRAAPLGDSGLGILTGPPVRLSETPAAIRRFAPVRAQSGMTNESDRGKASS